MATSAPGLQPSDGSSSQTSSSGKKTSADWKRYFEVLLERKKAADNGRGKGKPADIATEFSEAFQKHPVESSQPQSEVNALQLLMNKKRKLAIGLGSVHGQPFAARAFMSKNQQAKAREALADFFLEGSDAVALNMCEHPVPKGTCITGSSPAEILFATCGIENG
ncbi:TPA: hypothetical protein ACH3X1_002514 [Trebouxia sp. C0004]